MLELIRLLIRVLKMPPEERRRRWRMAMAARRIYKLGWRLWEKTLDIEDAELRAQIENYLDTHGVLLRTTVWELDEVAQIERTLRQWVDTIEKSPPTTHNPQPTSRRPPTTHNPQPTSKPQPTTHNPQANPNPQPTTHKQTPSHNPQPTSKCPPTTHNPQHG